KAPELEITGMAAIDGCHVGRQEVAARTVLVAIWIVEREDEVEVAPVRGRIRARHRSRHHRLPDPRARREPEEERCRQAKESRQAEQEPLVERPAIAGASPDPLGG